MHYTYMNPVVSSYAFGWFFGSLLPVCSESHHQQRCHHIPQTVSTIIDAKSFSGLDRLGGGLVIRRVGNGSEFCLCIIIDSHLKEAFSKVRGLVSKLPKKLLAATDGLGYSLSMINHIFKMIHPIRWKITYLRLE